jgi:hypothetical protein
MSYSWQGTKIKTKSGERLSVRLSLGAAASSMVRPDVSASADLGELSISERDSSRLHRIAVDISPIVSNPLINITGENSFEDVLEAMDFIEEEDVFAFSQEEVLQIINGSFFVRAQEGGCKNKPLKPFVSDLSLVDINGSPNYDAALCYHHSNTQDVLFSGGRTLYDGIPVHSFFTDVYEGRQVTFILFPFKHNLSPGDEFSISGGGGTARVSGLGGLNRENEGYIAYVEGILNLADKSIKKIGAFGESEYMAMVMKKLPGSPKILPSGFSSTIYNVQKYSAIFDEIDLSGLKDAFGDEIHELYFYMLKKRIEGGVLTYTPSLSGFDFKYGFARDIRSIWGGVPGLETHSPGAESFIGDIIERDRSSASTYVLSRSALCFNTMNREAASFYERYWHYALTPLKIRAKSEIASEAISEDKPYPSAEELAPSFFVFRELLGYDDSGFAPFVNGAHQYYFASPFFLFRQDVCGEIFSGIDGNPISGNCADFSILEEKTNFVC